MKPMNACSLWARLSTDNVHTDHSTLVEVCQTPHVTCPSTSSLAIGWLLYFVGEHDKTSLYTEAGRPDPVGFCFCFHSWFSLTLARLTNRDLSYECRFKYQNLSPEIIKTCHLRLLHTHQ